MSEEHKASVPRWISISASLATLSIPLLYIVGFGYDFGYLSQYGLSTEFFPRTVQEYLVLAFFSLLDLAISLNDFSRAHFGRVVIAASIVALMALVLILALRSGLDRRILGLTNAVRRTKYFDYVFYPVIAFSSSLVTLYVIAALVFTLLFAPTFGYFQGRKAARQEIGTSPVCHDVAPEGSSDCMVLRDAGREILKGRFIARSATHIALYDGKKSVVLPLREYAVEASPAADARKPGP